MSTEGERPPSAMAPHPIVVSGIAGLACIKERDRVTRMYERPYIVFDHHFFVVTVISGVGFFYAERQFHRERHILTRYLF